MSTRRRYFLEIQVRTDRSDTETDLAVDLFAGSLNGQQLNGKDGRPISAEIRTTRVRDYSEMQEFFHEEEEDDRDQNETVQRFPNQQEINDCPMSPEVIKVATSTFEQNVNPDDDLEDMGQVALGSINAAKAFIIMLSRMTPQE